MAKRIRLSISQENIPELIESILPIWQREIDRIQELETPSKSDLDLTVSLMKAMTQAYTMYRVLKSEVKREAAILPPAKLVEMIEKYKHNLS
jgi:hypothetical protein